MRFNSPLKSLSVSSEIVLVWFYQPTVRNSACTRSVKKVQSALVASWCSVRHAAAAAFFRVEEEGKGAVERGNWKVLQSVVCQSAGCYFHGHITQTQSQERPCRSSYMAIVVVEISSV